MPYTTRDVAILLYEGVTLLDVAGPAEALHFAQDETSATPEAPLYRLHFVSAGERVGRARDWVTSSAGLPVKGMALSEVPARLHTLLIPGGPESAVLAAMGDPDVMGCLRALSERAERLASVCSGAFLLGELGLLDGKRATTHWAGIAALAERFPLARVSQDQLFEQDGNVWSSAGVLSGVDMTLALIEADFTRDIALAVARRLVVFLARHGGQSQFSAPMSLQGQSRSGRMGGLVAWLQDRLGDSVSISAMAAAVSMSERTLHRRCKQEFGMTPAQLLAELRLEHARALLLSPDRSIKTVAAAAGYATSSSLTKAFTERYGVPPSRYRENFVGH